METRCTTIELLRAARHRRSEQTRAGRRLQDPATINSSNEAKLKAVLSYHVVTGYIAAKDVKAGEVMTTQGSALTAAVSSSGAQVNGAHVKQADLAATNGVIHAIDAVILPKNWQLPAAAA